MSGRWAILTGIGALVFACGERSGDPIVARGSVNVAGSAVSGSGGAAGAAEPEVTGGAATAGAADGGATDPGSGGAAPALEGPTGLCGPCETSETCGDANDACIRYEGESFCGRDCDEGRGCPDGYTCVQLANSRLLQCVPTAGCSPTTVTPPSLDQIRDYLLMRINTERVTRGYEPLVASTCLDGVAQESAIDYASTDEPLGKFVKECDPVWPACECGWSAEAENTVAHYGLDWSTAIDRALGGPDNRFIESFLGFDVTDVGIGFWISGDEAWIALSFR